MWRRVRARFHRRPECGRRMYFSSRLNGDRKGTDLGTFWTPFWAHERVAKACPTSAAVAACDESRREWKRATFLCAAARLKGERQSGSNSRAGSRRGPQVEYADRTHQTLK